MGGSSDSTLTRLTRRSSDLLRGPGPRLWPSVLLSLFAAACGSDACGGATSAGGAITAGGAGQLAGLGSYDLVETGSGFDVTLYDLAGERLGVAALEPQAGVWVATYEAVDDTVVGARLEVALRQRADDEIAWVTYRLSAAKGDAGSRTLSGELTWSGGASVASSGSEAWQLERVMLESALPSGASPPGIGGLVGVDGGAVARVSAFDRAGDEATAEELSAWLDLLDLSWLSESRAAAVLLALAHDGALASAMLDPTSQTRGALSWNGYSLDNWECNAEDLAFIEGLYRRACTELDGSAKCADGPSLLDYFTDGGCQQQHLECMMLAARIGKCSQRLVAAYDDAQCEQRFPGRCQHGLAQLGNEDAGLCLCVCLPAVCAQYCADVAASLDLVPTGAGQCAADAERCECPQDASAWCAAMYDANDCGGGVFSQRLGAYVCNTSVCGDGKLTATCDRHPLLAEACDASAPDGGTACASGFLCKDCLCVPSTPPPDVIEPDTVAETDTGPGYPLLGTVREGRFFEAGLDRLDMPVVSDARVALLDGTDGRELAITTTDALGAWAFDVEGGTYAIRFSADDFATLTTFTTGAVGPGGQRRDVWLTPLNPSCQSDGDRYELVMGLTGSIGTSMSELDVFGPENLAEQEGALDPGAALVCISGAPSGPELRWHLAGLTRVLGLPSSSSVTRLQLIWDPFASYSVTANAGTSLPQPFVLGDRDGAWSAPATFPPLEGDGTVYSLHFELGDETTQVLRFRVRP